MYFLQPQTLWLLAAVPLTAAALVWLAWFLKERILTAYGDRRLIERLSRPLSNRRFLVKGAMAVLAAALLTLALARPAVTDGHAKIQKGTLDVIAVVDVSRSMAAQDYKDKLPPPVEPKEASVTGENKPVKSGGTRLDMARHLIRTNLIHSLQGNQLGVVSYAGQAFPQAFLTGDGPALNWVLDRALTISSAPGEGSAMVKALELALLMFEVDSPADHDRLIVLFSDGGCTDDQAKLAKLAAKCREMKIKVIVVGLGKATPSPIPVAELADDDEFARGLFHNGKQFYEVDGEVEKTALDGNLLQALARDAGGTFVFLTNPGDFNLIDHAGGRQYIDVAGSRELFEYPLLAGLLCLVILMVSATEWRKRGAQ